VNKMSHKKQFTPFPVKSAGNGVSAVFFPKSKLPLDELASVLQDVNARRRVLQVSHTCATESECVLPVPFAIVTGG